MSSLDVRAIDDKDLRKEPSPKVTHGYRVFLAEQAFDRAVERGSNDTSREIGGVLVGEVLRDDAGPYLRIEDTIDALHAEEKGAELTFTHATWEHINKEMDTRHQKKQIVGWYHTHPGFGIFLSDRDQFIHKSFFNLPYQVAFVYDPKTREHGMFAWHDNEVVRARRYWVGAREQTWDGARTAPPPDDRSAARDVKKERAEVRPSDDLPPLGMGGLIASGIVILLIGGLGGHFLGSCSAGRELQAAHVEIAKAKQDGAQLAIASLQNELVALLRETMGDAAVHKPVAIALKDLDEAIAVLEGKATGNPSPAAGSAPQAAPGSAATGSAAPVAAGSAPAPGNPAPVAPAADVLATAKKLRESLRRLAQDRSAAANVLAQLEMASQGGASPRETARELASQRAGLGALYAELAVDVAKTDKARARRLFAMAARFDPANRPRYEKQLKTFDPTATLPSEPGGTP